MAAPYGIIADSKGPEVVPYGIVKDVVTSSSDKLIVSSKGVSYYITKEFIGGGAFGSVWVGYSVIDKKKIAIKQISFPKSLSDKRREELSNEIYVLLLLECHPAIVCMYDYAIYKTDIYIMMEYIDGKPIKSLPSRLAAKIIKRIAEGLEYLHSKHVVHRDIKPDNILITPDNQVKIVDVGIACSIPGVDKVMKCSDSIQGTPTFIDPLRLLNITGTTEKSDIFSFGLTLYHLITQSQLSFYGIQAEEMVSEYDKCIQKLTDIGIRQGYHRDIIYMILNMMNPIDDTIRPSASKIISMMNKLI